MKNDLLKTKNNTIILLKEIIGVSDLFILPITPYVNSKMYYKIYTKSNVVEIENIIPTTDKSDKKIQSEIDDYNRVRAEIENYITYNA